MKKWRRCAPFFLFYAVATRRIARCTVYGYTVIRWQIAAGGYMVHLCITVCNIADSGRPAYTMAAGRVTRGIVNHLFIGGWQVATRRKVVYLCAAIGNVADGCAACIVFQASAAGSVAGNVDNPVIVIHYILLGRRRQVTAGRQVEDLCLRITYE